MLCHTRPLLITESGKKEFGRILKAFRERQGLSQREAEQYIADRCCGETIAFNTISAIERGHRNIETRTLLLLVQSGYGGMSFNQMADILTDRRLTLCEEGAKYSA